MGYLPSSDRFVRGACQTFFRPSADSDSNQPGSAPARFSRSFSASSSDRLADAQTVIDVRGNQPHPGDMGGQGPLDSLSALT
jgi:hypothetical protein